MNNKSAKNDFFFSSEFVSEGHPDKMCDILSDAILDAHIQQDPNSMVACEVSAKSNTIFVFGEITSKAKVDIVALVRSVVKDIGHYKGKVDDINVILELAQQAPEIANSLHIDNNYDQGAGDQGMMFGYATEETPELMPLTLILSRKLIARLKELRKESNIKWLEPDAKTLVTVEYNTNSKTSFLEPVRVDAIVISTQHTEDIQLEDIRDFLKTEVVEKVIPKGMLDNRSRLFLNHTGSFVSGGAEADAGLTGRKIIVDTYGGWGSHGGGAFSGKDASKVDRSGAYFARYIAKSIVHSKIAKRILVQISYCIGFKEALSVFVDTFGTGKICDREIEEIIKKRYDLRPGKIIEKLDLKKPVFQKAAQEGHFGWCDGRFKWEIADDIKLEDYIKE